MSLAATGAAPAELTWRAGVDVLSLGATKDGALACEAVIVFDPDKAGAMPYQRKRAGQTLSKGRFLGAQMEAWLAGDLWLELARRANGAARRLAEGLAAAPGLRLAFPVEANEVFVVAPDATLARWRAAGAKFHDWSTRSARPDLAPRTGETMARLVTSFETSEAEVDALLALAGAPQPKPQFSERLSGVDRPNGESETMSRVQHSKPSRRLGWAAAALVLLALPTAAQAQGFFFLFGSPSPYEIERRLEAAGYALTGPLTLRGDVYLADVVVRGEGPERLVIDAQSGRIIERYRGRADRWREAAAPPPVDLGRRSAPVERAAPARRRSAPTWRRRTPSSRRSPTSSRRPRPKPKKPVRDQAEVDAQAGAGRQCEQPAARRRRSAAGRDEPAAPPPAVSSSPAAAPASPSPAPSAAAAPASPLRPRAPSIEAAKADAPSVAKPPAAAPAPAKSKAVNDIPVTPLD